MMLIGLLLILSLLWILAYNQAKPLLWLTLPPALLLSLQESGWLPGAPAGLFWLAYAGLAFFYLLPGLRKRLISSRLLQLFRRLSPSISTTEQEALNAGSVWFEAELFRGRPDWNKLLEQPAGRLTERERAFIDGPVEELCRRLDDWRITHVDKDLPPEIWEFMKRSGLFGMIIPESYGGLGFSALAHSTVVVKIASRSITAAVTVMVPNSLGPAKLLLHYGTAEQKQRYLKPLAQGKEIPCFALTGPQAGSDAGAMPDLGIVEFGKFNGKRILGIRLNWEKRYITLAPVATLVGLAFKLSDPQHLLGQEQDLGITLALIPSTTPGVELGQRHMPLDIPFQNGPVIGRDVFIPLEWVIGGREGIGQGWRMLMQCLGEGRGISLPALAVGAGKLASRFTGAYAAVRRQFGLPIGRFEGVDEALARIAGLTYQMDSARRLTLDALDAGERPSVMTAMIKYHLTERFRQVVNDAMDVQGGSGICLGPRNLLGRAYESIPIAITVEGANILTRNMIIFGQGAIRCHPYLLEELQAAGDADPKQALQRFDQALFGHIGYVIVNTARALWLGLTRGRFSPAPSDPITRRFYQKLNWLSAAFALSADLCLLSLGAALKRKERISARLGDLLSELYIASSTLRRFAADGSPAEDIPLLRWAMLDSLWRIRRAFISLLQNLPIRPLAWLLQALALPTGLPFRAPSDRLEQQVAQIILQPGAARDRLTDQVYTNEDENEPQGALEAAFTAAWAAMPIEERLKQARRSGRIDCEDPAEQITEALKKTIISRAEADILIRSEALRNRIIQVDSFERLADKPCEDKPFDLLGAA